MDFQKLTKQIDNLLSSFDSNKLEDWMQIFMLQYAILNDDAEECPQELKTRILDFCDNLFLNIKYIFFNPQLNIPETLSIEEYFIAPCLRHDSKG